MPDRVALYLQDAHPIRDTIRYVQHAETRGFEAVWQAESRFNRDATIPLAAFGASTSRIQLGTGVMNIWTRNVATIASTFLTMDDLATDRIMCGLGTWYDPLASQVGINRDRPLLAMREMVQGVRALLTEQRTTLHGQFVNLNNVELSGTPRPYQTRKIPIYIGATGPKMMALSGEIADGVLLNYMVSPQYTAAAAAQVEIGTRKANRHLDSVERAQLIVCSVDRDRKKALDRARYLVTQYLRQQPQIMRASGVRQELIDEIAQVLSYSSTEEDTHDAMRLVPDDVVQMVTAAGTPEECKAKIREYVAAGASCPVLYPFGTDVNFMIDTFAYGYSI